MTSFRERRRQNRAGGIFFASMIALSFATAFAITGYATAAIILLSIATVGLLFACWLGGLFGVLGRTRNE